ncbi:unnamed protein product, partial [Mesorhabditis spiculigera]
MGSHANEAYSQQNMNNRVPAHISQSARQLTNGPPPPANYQMAQMPMNMPQQMAAHGTDMYGQQAMAGRLPHMPPAPRPMSGPPPGAYPVPPQQMNPHQPHYHGAPPGQHHHPGAMQMMPNFPPGMQGMPMQMPPPTMYMMPMQHMMQQQPPGSEYYQDQYHQQHAQHPPPQMMQPNYGMAPPEPDYAMYNHMMQGAANPAMMMPRQPIPPLMGQQIFQPGMGQQPTEAHEYQHTQPPTYHPQNGQNRNMQRDGPLRTFSNQPSLSRKQSDVTAEDDGKNQTRDKMRQAVLAKLEADKSSEAEQAAANEESSNLEMQELASALEETQASNSETTTVIENKAYAGKTNFQDEQSEPEDKPAPVKRCDDVRATQNRPSSDVRMSRDSTGSRDRPKLLNLLEPADESKADRVRRTRTSTAPTVLSPSRKPRCLIVNPSPTPHTTEKPHPRGDGNYNSYRGHSGPGNYGGPRGGSFQTGRGGSMQRHDYHGSRESFKSQGNYSTGGGQKPYPPNHSGPFRG